MNHRGDRLRSGGQVLHHHPGHDLARHAQGDWGCVCNEDREMNDEALELGNRILSAYPIDPRSRQKVGAKTRSGSSPRPTAA
ncbi:DNA modification methyltransferase-related protein (plasmid) [Roseomonas mucosa]|uniref:DNA modification methyltransferase-related protein n=1 Tax=Roseomonas mucosa TaxID=207340 RepID=A0A4Y1MPZ9_9PROT|nr:DNA modification methyltransferase-related protein [Roseomonas mucosa]